MDTQPSTSSEKSPGSDTGEVLSPRKKRPRSHLSPTEKLMVQNVFKHVYSEEKEQNVDEKLLETPRKRQCIDKTANILGIGSSTVYNILKDIKENISPTSPLKPGPKQSILDKIDEFTFSAIRRKVHGFFYRKEAPTIAKITNEVNEDPDLPNLSRSSMRKVLKHINFKYASRKRRSCLIDRNDIILWRKKYLLAIKKFREEGKFIYYQDETWVNEGHTTKKSWVDLNITSPRQAFLEGLTTGLKGPTGKGKRLIISHIGSVEGFVDGACLMFLSKTDSSDYHSEMNSQHFEEWLEGILPKLKNNSVLVLDNAPYHSRKIEKSPTTAWRKTQIKEWLDSKNLEYEDTMVRAQLLEIVKSVKSSYQRYFVDELAAAYGITILRLPPYHCELNPIELVWAQVKGHVAKNNKTFKMAEVMELFKSGLNMVTPQRWLSCINHVIKEEKKMMQLDHLIDDVVDSFIIHVTDSDTESDSEKYDSE